MRIRDLALVMAALASLLTPATAAKRIADDHGGQIGRYLQLLNALRSSGERVIVDGDCLSACTLVLGIIPHNRLCATRRARFGFHAAWLPNREGRPATSVNGTRLLWRHYPHSVRRWITRHGGLSRQMIYLQGRALVHIVPSCTGEALTMRAGLRRGYARPSRYEHASAASERY